MLWCYNWVGLNFEAGSVTRSAEVVWRNVVPVTILSWIVKCLHHVPLNYFKYLQPYNEKEYGRLNSCPKSASDRWILLRSISAVMSSAQYSALNPMDQNLMCCYQEHTCLTTGTSNGIWMLLALLQASLDYKQHVCKRNAPSQTWRQTC